MLKRMVESIAHGLALSRQPRPLEVWGRRTAYEHHDDSSPPPTPAEYSAVRTFSSSVLALYRSEKLIMADKKRLS
jgi:hypothetical protein